MNDCVERMNESLTGSNTNNVRLSVPVSIGRISNTIVCRSAGYQIPSGVVNVCCVADVFCFLPPQSGLTDQYKPGVKKPVKNRMHRH